MYVRHNIVQYKKKQLYIYICRFRDRDRSVGSVSGLCRDDAIRIIKDCGDCSSRLLPVDPVSVKNDEATYFQTTKTTQAAGRFLVALKLKSLEAVSVKSHS